MYPLQLKFSSSVVNGVSVDYVVNFTKIPSRETLRSLAKYAISLGGDNCIVREWRSAANSMYTVDWLIWTGKQSADDRLLDLLTKVCDKYSIV